MTPDHTPVPAPAASASSASSASSRTTTPVVELTDVGAILGGRRILTGVNLTIHPGVFAAVLGPNGAGKTTLLRSIMGIIPTTGRVSVAGSTSRSRVHSVGYVPQSHRFNWDYPMDVRSVVLTGITAKRRGGLWATRSDWRAVGEALATVGITHLAGRHIGMLSGGQRQRVLLARALVSHPHVLLLDEPGTGLDLPGEQALLTTCRDLAATGVAVVMCTHDIGGAVDICDEIILVNGTVVTHRRPAELTDPRIWMDVFGVDEHSHLLRTAGCRPLAGAGTPPAASTAAPTALGGHA